MKPHLDSPDERVRVVKYFQRELEKIICGAKIACEISKRICRELYIQKQAIWEIFIQTKRNTTEHQKGIPPNWDDLLTVFRLLKNRACLDHINEEPEVVVHCMMGLVCRARGV